MVTLLKRNQKLVSIVTTAEIQMDPNPFGATLLKRTRDGNTVILLDGKDQNQDHQLHQLDQSHQLLSQHHHSAPKDALETNALVTEVDKPKLELEEPA